MKLDARTLLLPLIAAAVFVITLQQTLGALRASGSWRPRSRTPAVAVEDPYTRIDNLLGRDRAMPAADALRNPFAYGAARPGPVVKPAHPVAVAAPPPPAPPPVPSLTSIIWDNDPRATVRYDGHDISIRVNTLFADFRVTSITQDQVILDRNGESIVLTLRPKGD